MPFHGLSEVTHSCLLIGWVILQGVSEVTQSCLLIGWVILQGLSEDTVLSADRLGDITGLGSRGITFNKLQSLYCNV